MRNEAQSAVLARCDPGRITKPTVKSERRSDAPPLVLAAALLVGVLMIAAMAAAVGLIFYAILHGG